MNNIKDNLINYISKLNDNDLEKFFNDLKLKTNRFSSYTDIKSFNDACEYLDIDSNILPVVTMLDEKIGKSLIANYKLYIIYKAINKLNNNWTPDFTNLNQYKYYPYFKVLSSGLGSSLTFYYYDDTSSAVGVRLCTISEDVAIYIGKTFTTEYSDFLL